MIRRVRPDFGSPAVNQTASDIFGDRLDTRQEVLQRLWRQLPDGLLARDVLTILLRAPDTKHPDDAMIIEEEWRDVPITTEKAK